MPKSVRVSCPANVAVSGRCRLAYDRFDRPNSLPMAAVKLANVLRCMISMQKVRHSAALNSNRDPLKANLAAISALSNARPDSIGYAKKQG
ncbi:hypothetical protein K239x_58200 [Planctomycetes bacterium K23_9]|uniref:Uncharacterized protein n=1 Tax=Stieleria marina TaxID=1930275 RepID=A0A517P343_9BACT|nr:hypothetical protein K239x_58200 [Planctomycetes bacterium K23_9]